MILNTAYAVSNVSIIVIVAIKLHTLKYCFRILNIEHLLLSLYISAYNEIRSTAPDWCQKKNI